MINDCRRSRRERTGTLHQPLTSRLAVFRAALAGSCLVLAPLAQAVAAAAATTGTPAATEATATTETIVLVRHGEKPAEGLGQLDCQGLNRSLALPAVIERQFGRPAAIFAPNPSVAKEDSGKSYDYVRPLATIEPTAIALGLPVDVSIGFADIDALGKRLEAEEFAGAFVLVAWEHYEIVELVRRMVQAHGGDATAVPEWKGSDFDSIYVLRLTRSGDATAAAFERRSEGLDKQPASCPARAPG